MKRFVFSLLIASVPAFAFAQMATTFGSLRQDTSLPVEISSDSLSVDQATGSAVFTGNVVIGQGNMRLSAARMKVDYGADGQGITSVNASGGVTLTSGPDAAESQSAAYDINTGKIRMTGNVLLTQGPNALSADSMTVDLNTGAAQMEGRVKTIIAPARN